MLLASKIHRPAAPIVLGHGPEQRTYYFKPIDPQNPNSEHVCEVDNDDDIATLLAIREGYCLAKSRAAAPVKPAVIVPPAPSVPSTPATAATDTAPEPAAPVDPATAPADQTVVEDPDILAAATKLHELPANAFKAEVKKGGIPKAVLEEALRIEQAKPVDDQRETLISVLGQAITTAG